MDSLSKIANEQHSLFQSKDTMELNSFISQAKKDDIELIQSIGKTVEKFAVLWINKNITHDEFVSSVENVLNMKKLRFYKFSDGNKNRINHIIEKLNELFVLGSKGIA